MKPPSDKFANLGPPGIARRLVTDEEAREKARARVARWRKAHPELSRERTKGYVKKHRAKKKGRERP